VRVAGPHLIARTAVSGEALIVFVHNAANAVSSGWLTAGDAAHRVTELLSGAAGGPLSPNQPLPIQLAALDSTVFLLQREA
jgi:hypothetical protein